MKQIESHTNEQFITNFDECGEVVVKIPQKHWVRSGQIHNIVLHDNTYVDLDVTDPHTIHVRKK